MAHFKTLTLILTCAVLCSFQSDSFAAWMVKIEAGKYDRLDGPVAVELPSRQLAKHPMILTSKESNQEIPIQIDVNTDKPKLYFMLDEPLYKNNSREYTLRLADGVADQPPAVKAVTDDRGVTLKVGDNEVLRYNSAVIPCPDKTQPHYARSGFIHPIHDPAGNVLTDGFPPDHLHQHGLFMAWQQTTFDGQQYNFWEQTPENRAQISHANSAGAVSGPVFGDIGAVLGHDIKLENGQVKRIANELWHMRAYKLDKYFLVDLEIGYINQTEKPIQVMKIHYGGFAIRGRRSWFESGDSDFLTSEGKTRENGNHSRPNWVEIHGSVPGGHSGITIMSDPENFRHPQPVRLHPSKPYFCFAPMVTDAFSIESGKAYLSKYRLLIHNAEPDKERSEAAWKNYSEPITSTLIK
tara:strand:- start:22 stop:1248 length:1227 start_codon:yes stop_codon:yes gene_type:complete